MGFNHRFHPAISHAVSEAASGRFGPITHVRGRYGHGGRVGYEREWRADRARSGGGELVDQGMHLLDLSYALLGPLPLHSALLRTAFWPMDVEDNAVVILGERESGPWALFHTSWTEWKNLFSLEVFCATGKLQVDGLAGSYGEQRLVIFAMRPEMGVAGRRGAELPVGRRVVGARMGGVHRGRLGRGRPTVGGETSGRPGTAGAASRTPMPAPSVEESVPERALLSIVIPTYNEEANVPRVYERLTRCSAGSTSTPRSSSASTRRRIAPST